MRLLNCFMWGIQISLPINILVLLQWSCPKNICSFLCSPLQQNLSVSWPRLASNGHFVIIAEQGLLLARSKVSLDHAVGCLSFSMWIITSANLCFQPIISASRKGRILVWPHRETHVQGIMKVYVGGTRLDCWAPTHGSSTKKLWYL